MGTNFEDLNFNVDLIEKDNISTYYSELFNSETNTIVHSSSETDGHLLRNKLIYIHDVPNYLNTKLSVFSKRFKVKKVNIYGGSLINITDCNTKDDYLLKTLSAKKRSAIRGCQKRLDLCIKPTYKVYYGAISKEEYDTLFKSYKNMLVRRLAQKQAHWQELEFWKERRKSTFDLINEKKACVFVIYNENEPISVNINTIYGKTIFGEVNAYNIDFLKFSLGFLALLNVIEWSIDNGYDLIDLSKGEFDYKEHFRNGEYTFQNHIIYDSKNVYALTKANFIAFRINFVQKVLPLLKKIGLDKLYHTYTVKKNKDLYQNVAQDNSTVTIEKDVDASSLVGLKPIDLDALASEYASLRKLFNDFLFLNFEYIKDASIYKSETESDTFFFKGKNAVLKYQLNK